MSGNSSIRTWGIRFNLNPVLVLIFRILSFKSISPILIRLTSTGLKKL